MKMNYFGIRIKIVMYGNKDCFGVEFKKKKDH